MLTFYSGRLFNVHVGQFDTYNSESFINQSTQSQSWCESRMSQTGIFHVLFTFYFLKLMLMTLFKFLSYHRTHTHHYQFDLLTLFQTHKKTKNTVY